MDKVELKALSRKLALNSLFFFIQQASDDFGQDLPRTAEAHVVS
jgi:hypothetical protein